MDLEEKWRGIFARRAALFHEPYEISHWTEKGFRERKKKIRRILKDLHTPGERVLDLGCGPGDYASFFDNPVLSDYALPVLKKVPKAPPLSRVCADLSALPFKPGTFDGLLSVGLLQCRRLRPEDPGALASLLKPGGWFVVETLNCDWMGLLSEVPPELRDPLRDFKEKPGSWPCYFVNGDFVLYQADKLSEEFRKAGLVVEKTEFVYSMLPAPMRMVAELMAELHVSPWKEKEVCRSFVLAGRKKTS